jgi:hypothetical protein
MISIFNPYSRLMFSKLLWSILINQVSKCNPPMTTLNTLPTHVLASLQCVTTFIRCDIVITFHFPSLVQIHSHDVCVPLCVFTTLKIVNYFLIPIHKHVLHHTNARVSICLRSKALALFFFFIFKWFPLWICHSLISDLPKSYLRSTGSSKIWKAQYCSEKVFLWRCFKLLTSFDLLASGISNPKSPHSKTFSYILRVVFDIH